ncbi:MAG TPA: hypothetical protein VNA57_12060 [Acidimicrobiales bacterium]|nr:hypothetical protein [Acidimicrobiales bacterium]
MNRGKVQRRALGVAVGIAGGIMGIAGLAWACTPQATTQSITPGAAPPGAEVTLTSENGYPSAAPVEIRWNSSEGPLLATAAGSGSFSVRFTVPDVHPDIYYVVGVQRSGGVITHKAVVSFEVTPATSTASGPARSGTGPTGAGQGGSTSSQAAGGSGTAGSRTEEQAATATPGTGPAFPAETGASATPSPSPSPAATAETAANSARNATASAKATSPAAGPATSAATTTGQGVTAPADDRERAPGGAEAAVSPSANSVSGDLWAGFSGGAADRASLAPDQPDHSSGTSPVAVGAALMSGGLVMLFAGFMVAEARRRRVGVAASSGGGGPRR